MRAAARAFVATFALLSVGLTVGCDEAANEDRARKVAFNLAAHAYSADRRYTCDDGNGGTLEWLERVKSMGDGRISVELLTRNGKSRSVITDPVELAAFDRLAAQLATGGGSRALFQRDATPDDLDRMAIIPLARIRITVAMTFNEPRIDDHPAVKTARKNICIPTGARADKGG